MPISPNLLILAIPPEYSGGLDYQAVFTDLGIATDALVPGEAGFPEASELNNYQKIIYADENLEDFEPNAMTMDPVIMEAFLDTPPSVPGGPVRAILFFTSRILLDYAPLFPAFLESKMGITGSADFSHDLGTPVLRIKN